MIGHGLAIVAAGPVAGVGLARATTRYRQGSLYEVSAVDPPTFASVAAVLLAVAAVALRQD